MRLRYLPGTYSYQATLLHELHITLKLALLGVYCLVLIVINQPTALALLLSVLLVATTLSGLTNERGGLPLLLALGVVVLSRLAVGHSGLDPLVNLARLALKLTILSRLLRWYGQTTPHADTLAWGQRHSRIPWLREFSFLISTTLSVQPAIRHDIARAIDAERLRTGSHALWFGWGTWLDILTNILVRALSRGYHIGQSALERGFTLDGPFTPPTTRARCRADWRTAAVGLLPACISLGVSILL